MISFEHIVEVERIHARPAGLLVKEAQKFSSDITVSFNGKTVDAKKIFGIMSLGIKAGDKITVRIDGYDEADAIPDILEIVTSNW